MKRLMLPLVTFAALALPTHAQDPGPTLPQLAELIKPHLIQAIPPVLIEQKRNWGKTSQTPHAIHWRGLRPEIVSTPRNDGHWQKVRLSPRDLNALELKMTEPKKIDADRQAFQVYLSFMVTINYEQQLWESGVRLYSDSTRARARIMLWMDVENTIRLDAKKGALLPDLVIRLRATKAKLAYNDLVVEHTAGVGGTAAKVIGEAIEGMIHELRPDLERQMLDRAGAAIVRAADTREIRLGLGAVLK